MTVTDKTPPKLNPQQKQQMENLKEEIDFWQKELDRAKNAGIDITELQKQLNQAEHLRTMLLKHYG